VRILYAGPMAKGGSCYYRLLALRRLGHEVIPFDADSYWYKNRFLHAATFALSAGPQVSRLNRDLLKMARSIRPNIFWADKVLSLSPETLFAIKGLGAKTVSYICDDPFGPRRDRGWRLFMKTIPLFDLHVTPRDVSIAEYTARGGSRVVKIQFAFEPTVHFPSMVEIPDSERTREVSFIGTPYDDRAAIISQLSNLDIPVAVSGSFRAWKSQLSPLTFNKVYRGPELWDSDYREGIWHSKINLSFVTHSNRDEFAHKSFEIAACQGLLCCERSIGHALRFVEDQEAIFFTGIDELTGKIRRYLPDVQARLRISEAGRIRAVRSHYDNDSQMTSILNVIEEMPPPFWNI